ncbi:MAG: hypothetical protein H7A18_08960 [Sinobacteraceae bacterium]|nr:hypothetical protein [Nevskiaceae bacterium]MCP5339080.1 hypothetical protein [Nevskiaceae bacterium]MCP5359989.1 hypothetical protein [Nevskiaceae bacterium]MCP5472191.1 hypothetical protein [Nevskiaceae bacterium]
MTGGESALQSLREAFPDAMPNPSSSADTRGDEAADLRALETAALLDTDVATNPVAAIDDLPAAGIDLRAHLLAIEYRLITQAMQRSGGTVAQAARLLGLRRTTLVEKLRKFGIAGGEVLSEV